MPDAPQNLPVPDADALPMSPVESHGDLAARWIAWLEREASRKAISKLTLNGYQAKIRYWIIYLEQVARTHRPTPDTIGDYVEYLLETKGDDEEVDESDDEKGDAEDDSRKRKITTVNFYLNTVKSFYRWCESKGFYPAIGRSIRSIREHHDGPLPALSHEEVVRLIAKIPETTLQSLRDRALISLMYATAFRTVSIVRANRDDLDLGRNVIRHQPKGHHQKDVLAVFAPSVGDLLRRYVEQSAADISIKRDEDGLPLFIALRREPGKRLSSVSVRKIVLFYMELAGHARREKGKLINPGMFSAHSIRRSAAVTTADAGGIELAQGLLGHASADTTRKAYARVKQDRDLRENAHRLDPLA